MVEENMKKLDAPVLSGPSRQSLHTPPISSAAATEYGRYNLIGKLGHGGMAEVFLGYSAGLAGFRKLVVIKTIHQQLVEEPGFLDMFLDEARLAARMNHPNVIQCFEVGNVNSSHFLAMEYLEGQALDRVRRYCVKKNVRIPERIAIKIISDALSGLSYAHTLTDYDGTPLDIVHRDISPQNIFVTYTGGVKILDFGVAKSSSHVVETQLGIVKGKYGYMSPEQARGNDVDQRADLWSIGVVLWETLAAQRLFKCENQYKTISAVLKGNIPSIKEVVPTVSEPVTRILAKALARNRSERYHSAEQMKHDLEETLGRIPGGIATQDEVANFMKDLFQESYERHKKVLQQCIALSEDASADSVSGLYTSLASVSLSALNTAGLHSQSTTGHSSLSPVESFSEVFQPGTNPQDQANQKLLIKLVVAGFSLVIVVIVALFLFFGSSSENSDDQNIHAAGLAQTTTPGGTKAANHSEQMPQKASKVQISLQGVPAGSIVQSNGEPTSGPLFEVPASDRGIDITVTSPGFETWEQKVIPNENRTIMVNMKVRTSKAGGPRPRVRHASAHARQSGKNRHERQQPERDAPDRESQTTPAKQSTRSTGLETTFGGGVRKNTSSGNERPSFGEIP